MPLTSERKRELTLQYGENEHALEPYEEPAALRRAFFGGRCEDGQDPLCLLSFGRPGH